MDFEQWKSQREMLDSDPFNHLENRAREANRVFGYVLVFLTLIVAAFFMIKGLI